MCSSMTDATKKKLWSNPARDLKSTGPCFGDRHWWNQRASPSFERSLNSLQSPHPPESEEPTRKSQWQQPRGHSSARMTHLGPTVVETLSLQAAPKKKRNPRSQIPRIRPTFVKKYLTTVNFNTCYFLSYYTASNPIIFRWTEWSTSSSSNWVAWSCRTKFCCNCLCHY